MNHDVTLISKAAQPPPDATLPDIADPRDHLRARVPRSTRLRQAVGAWLVQLGERIEPRPQPAAHDELFRSISILLAEPAPACRCVESGSRRCP